MECNAGLKWVNNNAVESEIEGGANNRGFGKTTAIQQPSREVGWNKRGEENVNLPHFV